MLLTVRCKYLCPHVVYVCVKEAEEDGVRQREENGEGERKRERKQCGGTIGYYPLPDGRVISLFSSLALLLIQTAGGMNYISSDVIGWGADY